MRSHQTAATQLAIEHKLGSSPLALYGFGGDTHHIRDFVFGQATEKTQFNDSALPGIELGQLVQRLIQGEQVQFRLSD